MRRVLLGRRARSTAPAPPLPSFLYNRDHIPKSVRVVEVGPRDGLQNEATPVSTDSKIQLINSLANAGLKTIEAGAFVSPKWVPKMADSMDVFKGITRKEGVRYAALTPNMKGMELALEAQADEVAVFAAASEEFSQKNINCTIDESLKRFEPVIARALAENVPVRGYVSCIAGCPYQGKVNPYNVVRVTQALLEMGCYEVSLGDTIGVGTPGQIVDLLSELNADTKMDKVAVHFHNTYGLALANIYAALNCGVAVVDSSIGGLGGCPYAKGATGNVSTEDVIYMLHGMGIETGVDMDDLLKASTLVRSFLNRELSSNCANALLSKQAVE